MSSTETARIENASEGIQRLFSEVLARPGPRRVLEIFRERGSFEGRDKNGMWLNYAYTVTPEETESFIKGLLDLMSLASIKPGIYIKVFVEDYPIPSITERVSKSWKVIDDLAAESKGQIRVIYRRATRPRVEKIKEEHREYFSSGVAFVRVISKFLYDSFHYWIEQTNREDFSACIAPSEEDSTCPEDGSASRIPPPAKGDPDPKEALLRIVMEDREILEAVLHKRREEIGDSYKTGSISLEELEKGLVALKDLEQSS